jgi:hypothetical protein
MQTNILHMNHWRAEIQRLLKNECVHPEGWSLSSFDPAIALAARPCLRMADGWRWITFHYMTSGDGNSVTFAVPGKLINQAGEWLELIRRTDASPFNLLTNGYLIPESKRHFMEAVIGDGSAESFAQAALLCREIGAIGACWHGIGWDACEILYRRWRSGNHQAWQLTAGCRLPGNSTPVVFIEENVAHCRFYYQSDLGGRTISLCEDIFCGSSMRPTSIDLLIATSPNGGWIP